MVGEPIAIVDLKCNRYATRSPLLQWQTDHFFKPCHAGRFPSHLMKL